MAGTVLVVEDDAAVVASLRDALAKHAMVVESVDTAKRATEMLNERIYCGLVLDLVLTTGSGFDVLAHIAHQKIQVPTVVVTHKLPDYVREMLNAEHVKLVFPKPVEPRLLAAVILGMCGITSA